MAARFLTRQVANHVTMSHLMPAVGFNVQLHTAAAQLDSPDSQISTAPNKVGDQQAATPAESQHNQSKGELPQAAAAETSRRYNWPERGHTPAGSGRVQRAAQQREVNPPGRGTPRDYQLHSESNDRQASHGRTRMSAQGSQAYSNRLGVQPQRSSAPQSSSNFGGQPDMSGPASGLRPAFVDRSGSRSAFIDRSKPDQGPRPAFIDRSKPDQAPRPAFIDRSGAANRNDMADQRHRQPHRAGPHSQQGRPAPGNARMPMPDVPDPDDPDQHAFDESRRRSRTRKATPSSFRTERGAPGSNLRGGGPAKGSQGINPAVLDDDADSLLGYTDEKDAVSENFLERMQYNPRGVPASWKDEIQDMQDQEDLDEAREISAFNRRRRSGEVRDLEEELRKDMHTLAINSDPRLEFGLETPLLQESDAPDAADLLESAKGQLCGVLGIENDEEWQEVTEGLTEEFTDLDQQLHQGLIKPKVREWSLENFVEQSMPSTHPMYPTVSQSLRMLQSNPNWAHDKKLQYMRRLIKDLS